MTTEQWRAVTRILDAARGLPEVEQHAFITSEASDPEVFRRIMELIEMPGEEELEAAAPVNRTGTQVGRYRVAGLLGRGGMGEVYAARDRDLDRSVALKFLTAGAGDPSAVRRFVREAKAASALNHPNVLIVHEVIQSPSGLAIAMELVEGKPLSDFVGAPLPVQQVVAIGRQVASALAAAHQQKIVHRDIKPANLMLRPDGLVKVLDFGLARDFTGKIAATLQPSAQALPAGTLRYMSPEQLRAEPVTGASDIFSLGLLLYELAAGRHPFEADYLWETAHAIHTCDPAPPSSVNREAPAWLDDLILSMLERDAGLRPSAEQVETALATSGARMLAPRRRVKGRRGAPLVRFTPWVAAAVSVIALAAYAWLARRPAHEAAFKVVPLATFAGPKSFPALSPDGSRVAFCWQPPGSDAPHLYVKPVREGQPVQLTSSRFADAMPAWSPDGRQIAFCRQPNGDQDGAAQEIMIVPANGGLEHKVANAWRGVSWSADGKTLALAHVFNESPDRFRQTGGIFLLALGSGQTRELTASHKDGYPVFSPDGKWIVFKRYISGTEAEIQVVPAEGGKLRRLTANPYPTRAAAWTADSREIVFASLRSGPDGSLWRVSLEGGAPRPISPTLPNASDPSVSRQGLLAYREEWNDTNLYRLTARDFQGAAPARFSDPVASLVNSSREDHSPDFSPDGERVAFVSDRSGTFEVWVAGRDGSQAVQLTKLRAQNLGSPRWSPDGRRIAFDSWASGHSAIYVVDSAGGVPHMINLGRFGGWMPSWSPDGQWIYFSHGLTSPTDIWRIPAAGGEALPVTRGGAFESRPSADGRLVFFSKGSADGGNGIWSVAAAGGSEEPVADLRAFGHIGRCWGVLDKGIYFISYEAGRRQTVRFLSFRTHRVTPLFSLEKQQDWGIAGLTLSPDAHFALATQMDHTVNELMMVENFR